MLRVVLPRLVIVTFFAGLEVPTFTVPKFKLPGASFTAVPVPVRGTDCVPALSTMVNVPVCSPAAVGVNFTDIMQLPPAATLDPQVLVSENSELAVTLVMSSAPPPVFVNVTVFAALVV